MINYNLICLAFCSALTATLDDDKMSFGLPKDSFKFQQLLAAK